MFLLVVVVVAALGGFVPAFVCAITGFLLANWYFTPPYHEFTISEGENLLALVIFLLVGGVVSLLVATASRRTADAARARAEAETLARAERHAVGVGRPAPAARRAAAGRRSTPSASPCCAERADGTWTRRWRRPATPCRQRPDDADVVVPLHGDRRAGAVAATTLGRRRPRGPARRSPARWRSRCSNARCAPTPSAPRGSRRRTSCAPRCSRRCRTTCARRCRRSRRR